MATTNNNNPSSTADMDTSPALTTTTTTTTSITTTTSAPPPPPGGKNAASLSSGGCPNMKKTSPPFKPPVLVLGGTGTVGSRIAAQLAADNHPVVIASRGAPSSLDPTSMFPSVSTSEDKKATTSNTAKDNVKSSATTDDKNKENSNNPNVHRVHFDWEDRTTWSNPFRYISSLANKALSSSSSSTQQQDNHGGPGGSEMNKKPPVDLSPYSTTAAERESIRRERSEKAAQEARRWKIHSAYLIAPPGVLDAASVMMDFVDFARSEDAEEGAGGGIKRFVLQSASCIEPGGPAMGKVHGYFRELGNRGEIEWAVLRPSWFQQNFAVQENHLQSIRDEAKIYSATGDGKIPWISADDIAAVAVQALTMPEPPNTEFLVLGPELLSYDDIAATLSEIIGKKIVHVDMTSADLERRHRAFGMPEDYSSMMSALDTGIKYGMENRTNDLVLSITGSAPGTFKEYAASVRDVWVTRDGIPSTSAGAGGGGENMEVAGPTQPVDAVWANA